MRETQLKIKTQVGEKKEKCREKRRNKKRRKVKQIDSKPQVLRSEKGSPP